MADNGSKDNPAALIVGEVVEAVRQEKNGSINVNILIQQVSQKSHNPEELLETTEKALALAEKWEQSRLTAFKERVNAIIDAKLRDPDEVDKRQNNQTRRTMKHLITWFAAIALVGGLSLAFKGASVVVVVLTLLIGVVAIAIMGPLASGESVSAADVAHILQSAGGLMPGRQTENRPVPRKRR